MILTGTMENFCILIAQGKALQKILHVVVFQNKPRFIVRRFFRSLWANIKVVKVAERFN